MGTVAGAEGCGRHVQRQPSISPRYRTKLAGTPVTFGEFEPKKKSGILGMTWYDQAIELSCPTKNHHVIKWVLTWIPPFKAGSGRLLALS